MQDPASRGVNKFLCGHSGHVNAVKIFPTEVHHRTLILSGAVDSSIRVWQNTRSQPKVFAEVARLEGHTNSVNCLAVCEGLPFIASGSADATVRIWRLFLDDETVRTEIVQVIRPSPRFFPLALALHRFDVSNDIALAITGTTKVIQVLIGNHDNHFVLQATLTGHEGWIRSLAFCPTIDKSDDGVLLASASQDKYIRLWRIKGAKRSSQHQEDLLANLDGPLSNRMYKLTGAKTSYILTFEALLLGHDDWIYTVSWCVSSGKPRLLSASEDSSLAVWEMDEDHGVWIPTTRLGQISGLKGSTTATGSAGGFWIGLWGPSGTSVVSLGRTGGWRLWHFQNHERGWVQLSGITGHCKSVSGIAWSKMGSFLLSTGSDQTTRLHAEWVSQDQVSWHEMARPQIHGYDLNCIDCIGETQFVSGADEKSLRVFDKPRATGDLLQHLSGIQSTDHDTLPTVASIPVLGLSNKATEVADIDAPEVHGEEQALGKGSNEQVSQVLSNDHALVPTGPPGEDQLGRHTLWPEREKLYGHGYEIAAVAVSHDGSVIATSCRASSIEHAVIRLYTTHDWREMKPALMAHTLTVTALRFSHDDTLLLSVGRDRQWSVWSRHVDQPGLYSLSTSIPKGHTRMILDACWLPPLPANALEEENPGFAFATASRDRSVKLWSHTAESTSTIPCVATLVAESPVTAIDAVSQQLHHGSILLAVGTEVGTLTLCAIKPATWEVIQEYKLDPSSVFPLVLFFFFQKNP